MGGEVLEPCVLPEEGEFDRSLWPTAVLGHMDLADSFLLRLRVVVLIAVEKHDDVSVLLDGT